MVLDPLRQRLPDLRVVMEHITTIDAVNIRRSDRNLGADHAASPDDYPKPYSGGASGRIICLPVAKRSIHRVH